MNRTSADRLLKGFKQKVAGLPHGNWPVAQRARQRAEEASAIIADALTVDPTLTDAHRCLRQIDVVEEILRQLKPLSRQAECEMERRRLQASSADPSELARIGRTNPMAPDELEALSQRCLALAKDVSAQALPDWNTPQRIRERSEAMLPRASTLKEIAAELRRAVEPSLSLAYPAAEAVRLAALAEQITQNLDAEAEAA